LSTSSALPVCSTPWRAAAERPRASGHPSDATWRDQVAVAAPDPLRGYAAALSISRPQAVRVLDVFHPIRLGFSAVDDVRRRA
jgi:hypothetical protein